MAVTPGFLGIDEPAAIDKRADTNTMTRAATPVHREVVSIGSPDDATPEQIATVTAGGALKVDGSAATQPISGAVTQGTAAAASGAWPVKPTDASGVNQQAITVNGDAKITLDGEAVVLGAGAASIGTLGANSGVDIGDVTINNGAAGAAVNIQDGGNTITVDGPGTAGAPAGGVLSIQGVGSGTAVPISGAVSVSGAVDTELPAAAAIAAENTAAPTAPAVYGFGLVFDGTNWDRQPGTSADGTLVNLGANNDVVVTGSVDTELPAAETPADALTNATAAPRVNSLGYGFNGTTWDRLRADTTNGLDVDVTRLPALATGDNTVGRVKITDGTTVASVRDLAANDALNVAIVDGSGGQITSFGGGTEYTEDAVAAADPVGKATILVRKDTPAAITSTDGDNVAQRGTNYGAAYVQVVSSGGALIDSFGGSGGTAQADKSSFTEGTTTFTPVGGVYNETPTSDPTEDQAAVARITAKRAIHVNLRDATGAEVSVGGGTQYDEDAPSADGAKLTLAGAVRQDTIASNTTLDGDYTYLKTTAAGRLYASATIDAALPAGTNNIGDVDVLSIAAGDNNIGNVDVVTLPALPAGGNKIGAVDLDSDATPAAAVPAVAQYVAGTDGTNARGLKTDAAGELQVDVLTLPALAAGTNNIGDVDVLTLPALAAGTNNIGDVDILTGPTGASALQVQGAAAFDAAAVGNPLLVGVTHETIADSAPTNRLATVTDGDVSRASSTDGAVFVIPGGPQQWSYHENSSSALTDTSVHTAPGAGLSLYVSTIVVSTGSATAFNIFFEEGASTVLGPYYLEAVAGRGFAINFAVPKKITANTALTVTTSAAIAHSIDITGFIAPG